MSAIRVTYNLKPPANVDGGNKETTKKHELPINPSSNGSTAFYTALRVSLADARNQVGDELTAWRDIVGKAELVKEPKKAVEEDEEEEEIEEEGA